MVYLPSVHALHSAFQSSADCTAPASEILSIGMMLPTVHQAPASFIPVAPRCGSLARPSQCIAGRQAEVKAAALPEPADMLFLVGLVYVATCHARPTAPLFLFPCPPPRF